MTPQSSRQSSRQTLLLCLLAALLPTAAFAALRGAPRWRKLSGLWDTAVELRLDLASLPRPSGDAAQDDARVREAQGRVEALRAKLECCAPFAGPDDRRALALEVSNLAEESELWVESRETARAAAAPGRATRAAFGRHDVSSVFSDGDYAEPAPTARSAQAARAAPVTLANLGACLQAAPFSRHLERWVARGSFAALRAFLDGLSRLPHCVVVVHLELERPRATDGGANPPLRITMTVAL